MPGRSFAKPKLNKIIKSKKTRGDQKDVPRYVDAGQLEVEASLKDIPDGDGKYYDSMERKFGCLPWHLRLHKVVEKPKSAGQPTNFIEVYLVCSYKEQEHTWCAKATGVLRMEKWPEKLKDKSEAKTEHKENFIRKFNQNERQHKFVKKFPVPTSARYRCGHGNPAADSPYLKNGHFKFQLDITVHNVRKVHFPIYDFQKKTPMCNAIVKISGHDGNIQRFHVNKEYLSMHSDALGCMFSNPGFVEGSTGEVELKDIDTKVFNEFLAMIYPSRQRPHIKYMRGLLEFARMFFIPTVTAICEQRLLVAEEAEMGLGERLLLADTYGLFQLKSQIMQSLGQDTTKLEDKWTDKLSQETLQMLLRKQKQAKAAEDEAASKKKRGAEAMEVDPQPSNQRPRRGDDAVRSARRMGRGGQRRPQHGAANRRN